MSRLRVVFDCNTLIQAAAFPRGPAAAVLRHAEAGDFDFFLSKATLAELRRVLEYEEILDLSSHLTPPLTAAFVKRIAYRGTLVRRVPRQYAFPRDRKDEPYLDLAVQIKADYLVTRDKDLLSLMTGHAPFDKSFRQQTHPLTILDPAAFLRILRAQ